MSPEVEVRRSHRRTRTVSAYRKDGKVIVMIPARFTRAEETEWVDTMVGKLIRSEQRGRRTDDQLMRRAHELFAAAHPEVECDGEMHGDAALSEAVRGTFLPDSKLKGAANLLVLPTLDAANILFNVLKISAGNGVTVGPILLGAAAPVHILTPSATVRRIVNMTALAVADAQQAPRD